jgi:hypothetical protein
MNCSSLGPKFKLEFELSQNFELTMFYCSGPKKMRMNKRSENVGSARAALSAHPTYIHTYIYS